MLNERNPTGQTPSRTISTEIEYFHRYRLLRQLAAQQGITLDDHLGFAKWVVARRPTVVASYWRRLKAVALLGLDREGAASARDGEDLLRSEQSTGASKTPSRPGKLKRLPEEDLSKVLEALASRPNSELSRIAALWLQAGRLVGLRPCEWRDSSLLPADGAGGPYLSVINAKRTNGRSHGERRTLDLGPLRPEDRRTIEIFLNLIQGYGPSAFGRLQRGCTELLSRLNAELWPRRKQRITLYSPRHQFSADAKRVMRRRDLAALMGHRTTRTANLHYADRRYGVDRLGLEGVPGLPIPNAAEVERVIPVPYFPPAPTSDAGMGSGRMGGAGSGTARRTEDQQDED